jgi:hypothetical protein
MNIVLRSILLAALCFPSVACVSYSGVTKADGQLYISGGTSYWVYTQPWVRRCDVDGNKLNCEELTESAASARAPKSEGTKPAAPAPAK